MIECLRQRSRNVFELKAGTLYPLLHSLEERRYLESYDREAAGKVRKYYHMHRRGPKSPAGKKAGVGSLCESGFGSAGHGGDHV